MESHHRPIPKHRLRNARAMRHIATDAEKKLWRLLRSRQLEAFKFRRQVPIGNFIAEVFSPHRLRCGALRVRCADDALELGGGAIQKHRLRNARAMRHIATDAEKKLWRLLR